MPNVSNTPGESKALFKPQYINIFDEEAGTVVSASLEEMLVKWKLFPEKAPGLEIIEGYQKVFDYNRRLAVRDKEGKLTVDELFGKNYLSDAVKEALATYIETKLKREVRNEDGSIDFFSREYDDCCVDNQSLIIEALLPIVIETYDSQYGDEGDLRGALKWMRMKLELILSEMDAGDYRTAVGIMAESTCTPTYGD